MLVIYLFQGLPGLPGRAGFTGTKGDYVSASFGCLFLECRLKLLCSYLKIARFFFVLFRERKATKVLLENLAEMVNR